MPKLIICLSFAALSVLSSIALFPAYSVSAVNANSCTITDDKLDWLVSQGVNLTSGFSILENYDGEGTMRVYTSPVSHYFQSSGYIMIGNPGSQYRINTSVDPWVVTYTYHSMSSLTLDNENFVAPIKFCSGNVIGYQASSSFVNDQFRHIIYPAPATPPPASSGSYWTSDTVGQTIAQISALVLTGFVGWLIVKSFRFQKYE